MAGGKVDLSARGRIGEDLLIRHADVMHNGPKGTAIMRSALRQHGSRGVSITAVHAMCGRSRGANQRPLVAPMACSSGSLVLWRSMRLSGSITRYFGRSQR